MLNEYFYNLNELNDFIQHEQISKNSNGKNIRKYTIKQRE